MACSNFLSSSENSAPSPSTLAQNLPPIGTDFAAPTSAPHLPPSTRTGLARLNSSKLRSTPRGSIVEKVCLVIFVVLETPTPIVEGVTGGRTIARPAVSAVRPGRDSEMPGRAETSGGATAKTDAAGAANAPRPRSTTDMGAAGLTTASRPADGRDPRTGAVDNVGRADTAGRLSGAAAAGADGAVIPTAIVGREGLGAETPTGVTLDWAAALVSGATLLAMAGMLMPALNSKPTAAKRDDAIPAATFPGILTPEAERPKLTPP
mmetsp:Transcript_76503/g.139881  ORF Transcript_76503/g.139881 Transcript_76503/m.139881 type:complete len:264 (-) Transcript_76503:567-1358(-)